VEFVDRDLSEKQVSAGAEAFEGQYRLSRILVVWVVATLPMVVLAWGITPLLIPRVNWPPIIFYWLVVLLGMLWQFLLSLWIIRGETGGLKWNALRRRVWLDLPHEPQSGEPRARLLWRAIPGTLIAGMILALGVFILPLSPYLIKLAGLDSLTGILHMPSYTYALELSSPEFSGWWWLLPLALITWMMGAILGEELIFRGVLLPRMRGEFGKRDGLANAILYGFHYLYLPWAIPFRLVVGLVLARTARRFKSIWMAVAIRSVEVVGVILIVSMGVRSSPLIPIDLSTITRPYIQREPAPASRYRGKMTQLAPVYDNRTHLWQLDLRGRDLSDLDLRAAETDLMNSSFDGQTSWPSADRMPQDFSPVEVMEVGKNPGLGVRSLHDRGINGSGVGIAIIDQPLLTNHPEYVDQLTWYEEIAVPNGQMASMHGPALASIAVGNTIGVAPGADLYYFAVSESSLFTGQYLHNIARAIRRVLQINEQLDPSQKIRVISLSTGWLPELAGYYDLTAAVEEAKEKGIFIACLNMEEVYGFEFEGLGRKPLADPDDFNAYEPSVFWVDQFIEGDWLFDGLYFPMESKTVAGSSGAAGYEFDRYGGWSWISPYLAGLYVLAAQVDPAITPEVFLSVGMSTGRSIEIENAGKASTLGPIVDPVALIEALQE
jgi:membrane protease YdiL (CAAX protease family)